MAQLPASSRMSIAIQNLTGGFLCLLVGISLGEFNQLNLANVSARSLLSLAYLIFIGSFIGFSAYIWVLKKAEPALVSTYAYVNPIVAVFLGWTFANEQLALSVAFAAAVILMSVILITRASKKESSLPKPQSNAYAVSGADGDGI